MTPHDLISAFETLADAPDGVKQLRKLVLSLAVRGKLVAFNGASARSSCASGSPPESDEIPFDIPAHWSWMRLPEVSTYSVGKTPSTKDPRFWGNNAIPWVSIGDMPDGGIVASTSRTVTQEAASEVFRRAPIPSGTILMSFKLTIGKVALLGCDAYHNEAIISVLPKAIVDKQYLFTFLPMVAAGGETKDAIKGATLNSDSLAKVMVPLPPLAEQRRIVARVDEFKDLLGRLEAAHATRDKVRCAARDAVLADLINAPDADAVEVAWSRIARHMEDLFTELVDVERLRQAVLQLAVRGRLVAFNDGDSRSTFTSASPARSDEIPFGIPAHWSWMRLPEVSTYLVGRTPPTKDPRYWGDDAIPWVSISDMPNGGIVHKTSRTVTKEAADDVFRREPVPAGTILMSFKLTIGKVAVLGCDAYHNEAIISVLPKAIVDKQYLFTFLPMVAAGGETKDAIKGATLNSDSLAKILVPLPPLAEQRCIVAKIETLMLLCDDLGTRLTAARDLQRAFAGAAVHHLDV
jgi:type I restriction enzyme S subunit